MTEPLAYLRAGAAALAAMPGVLAEIANAGRPRTLVYFGGSPGDDLLCTPVIDGLVAAGAGPLWMMSNHPDLFRHNPSVAHVVPFDDAAAYALAMLGVRRVRLRYHDYDAADDRSLAPAEHIIRLLARRAGLDPAGITPAPRVYLDDAERSWGGFGDRQIAIQSSTRSAAMPIANKEWFPDRFQKVVDALGAEFTIVQLGAASDPALEGTIDLRGRTTIREAASVLFHSSVFIGLVGFLMHLAKAVDTRSVIVYGGREHPSQSGYADNVNLYTDLPCAPCWYWNHSPYDRECMRRIRSVDVVSAVRTLLSAA
jgi:glycosyl transferase family 9 (putative heptosyltransferase)